MQPTTNKKILLNEVESRKLLKKYGIQQNEYGFAKTKSEAKEIANNLTLPLVMKVVSPKIVHKSNFGGVKLGLNSLKDVVEAFDEINANANNFGVSNIDIDGVTVQEMESGVQELLIGVKKDDTFGNVLVVGLGGVFVELMKDVSLGISPLSESYIYKMVKNLKGFPLLDGYRGTERADVPAFVEMIKRVEVMVTEEDKVEELDLNPVIIKRNGDGCLAVDVRIITRA
ncbi:acetate--CoA ligase family protein [Salicibibacter cibarius]|uniref:Acetate--CoA ligase family protein n=1 Tax=Salicibibacter cibarius TaxID=2743000 RepID=A0A7T6Z7H3_9BACI|nr:acetate--CoA ligase family protein [Salicibibacter cibarius]QQK77786.1 acetate--CoA ligase family protein [Salicibibacter cibarius]